MARSTTASRNEIRSPLGFEAECRCSGAEWEEARERLANLAPKTLPASWQRRPGPDETLRCYVNATGLAVLLSTGLHEGRWWAHLSVSRADRLPTWDDLRGVKLIFFGANRKAIQVLPKSADYVNIHPHVLHLWSCLEPGGDGLPDFGKAGTI